MANNRNNRKKRSQKTRVLTPELEAKGINIGDVVDGAKIVPSRRKPAPAPETETHSVKDIYDSMTPLQRAAVHYIVGAATGDIIKDQLGHVIERAITNAMGDLSDVGVPVDVQD